MGLRADISQKFSGEQPQPVNPVAMNQIVGRSVTRLVTRHFQTYSAQHPNKLFGKRTNYVAKMGDATTFTADAQGVKIGISHEGVRLRVEGGTITPKKGKYLTIPAVAAAYGKRAREFQNLSLMFRRIAGKVRAVALAVNEFTPVGKGAPKKGQKAKSKSSGQVMFWLVHSATIPPNRDLLPTDEEITKTAIAAVDAYLKVKK